MNDTKFQKGKSGNPNGRPPGKSKFTSIKDSFITAFEEVGGTSKIIKWIREGNETEFFKILSKMLPREVSATVTINIEKYAFMPNRSIPPDVIREYLTELVFVQIINHEIKKKIIAQIKGDFAPKVLSLRDLKGSYARMQREGEVKVIPVKSTPVKSPAGRETVRKKSQPKPKPKPKVDPEIEAKKAHLKELEKELREFNETDD